MIEALAPYTIKVWIVAGSGFADAIIAAQLPLLTEVAYEAVPGIPATTVHGHKAVLRVVDYGGAAVGIFLGRHHLYEGHSGDASCALVRVAQEHGGTHIILTNASGGLDPSLSVGDIALLHDGIDFTFENASSSQRQPSSHRHPSAHQPPKFDKAWITKTSQRCFAHGIATRECSYAQVLGPSFETRAEIRMLRRMGADLVGMSTIHEASAATILGMHVLGISLVTNKASDTTGSAISHREVLETALEGSARLRVVLMAALDTA